MGPQRRNRIEMNENTPKIKDIYIPLACIGLAIVIMMIDVMFLSNTAYDNPLQGMLIIVVGKTILYTVVICWDWDYAVGSAIPLTRFL